jgi:peroxiredoxin
MELKKGDKAPSFKLFDTDKNEHSLESNNGKSVVLLFFPLAFTGVCTQELCGVRDDISSYNDLDANVYGISVDSIFSLGKFKKEQNINFSLLSDFNKEVSSLYGALYEEFVLGMRGVSKRSAFVIDSEGTIQYASVSDDAGQLPNFDAIKESLSAIK